MTAPTRRRVVPAGPRLADRARSERGERRRRAVRRLSRAALCLVALLLLAWLLLASPLLQVDRVQVVGASRVSAEQVRAVAGVAEGVPLARVDTDAVRARVAALAPVARARAVRAWPSTLRLVVQERVPLATAQQGDGTWVLVDGAGARFSPTAERPEGMPELRVAGEEPVGAAVRVLAELPTGLLAQVAAVQVPSASAVRLDLRDGRAVVWGAPGQAGRKAAVVAALLAGPADTVDVTSPEVAVVR